MLHGVFPSTSTFRHWPAINLWAGSRIGTGFTFKLLGEARSGLRTPPFFSPGSPLVPVSLASPAGAAGAPIGQGSSPDMILDRQTGMPPPPWFTHEMKEGHIFHMPHCPPDPSNFPAFHPDLETRVIPRIKSPPPTPLHPAKQIARQEKNGSRIARRDKKECPAEGGRLFWCERKARSPLLAVVFCF